MKALPLLLVFGLACLLGCQHVQLPEQVLADCREALRRCDQAMKNGDRERFLSCVFTASDDERQYVNALFDCDTALRRYHAKGLAHFGEATWTKLNRNEDGTPGIAGQMIEFGADRPIILNGHTAIRRAVKEKDDLYLIQTETGWRIQAASLLERDRTIQQSTQIARGLAGELSRIADRLGQQIKTADDFEQAKLELLSFLTFGRRDLITRGRKVEVQYPPVEPITIPDTQPFIGVRGKQK